VGLGDDLARGQLSFNCVRQLIFAQPCRPDPANIGKADRPIRPASWCPCQVG
jgi:hypothetical protein